LYLHGGEELESSVLARWVFDTTGSTIKNVEANYRLVCEQREEKYNVVEQPEEKKDIGKWLSASTFKVVDLSGVNYYYDSELNSCSKASKRKMARIRKDVAILSNSLPDGIFVRVDENRFDKMKVMIIGPQGTPYENGCFLFDLFLPADYPDQCPKMIYQTTGNGQMYFNPNLYTEGKICISLLGTWQGPGWDPETSTILQLLVSIQALVFVDYPLENEPGYEGRALDECSQAYNKGIQRCTALFAMQWHMDHTTISCFEDVIFAHLYHNREVIKDRMAKWSPSSPDYCSYFQWNYIPGVSEESWESTKTVLIQKLDELSSPKLD